MPKQTPDPLEITEEDAAMLAADVEAVQTEAKRTFKLADRLGGIKLATAKVVVFTDLEAAADWAAQEERVQRLGAIATATRGTDGHADAKADYENAAMHLDTLREAAFGGALAVHMRAVPQVAFEAAQRKARAEFAADNGQVPEAKQTAYFERQNEILLGQVIQRIVDSGGAEAEFERKRVSNMLRDALPVAQYQRLIAAFNTLMFNDSLARAATADPGF